MALSSIVAIGASSGGVAALRYLVAALPRTLAAPVLVVLHVGAHRSALPDLLNSSGCLPAKHGEDAEQILPGHIYVAPPDRHMVVCGDRIRLFRGPKENWARPAIDPLFRSVAEEYGSGAIGVILTGNLNDGTLGLIEIKQRGGLAIAQDPADAAYSEMPMSARTHVKLDHCPTLADMPRLLTALLEGTEGKEVVMTTTPSRQEEPPPELINGRQFERPLTVTCPDCGGALKRGTVGSVVKFGCHIGHTYTAEIMASAQFDEMEKVMRAAVRFLNERAEFCLQMAEHSQEAGLGTFSDWHAASMQALDRAYKLRDLVEQDWLMPEKSVSPSSSSEGEDRVEMVR